MKFVYDLLPILVFFIVYKFYNIFAATAFAIVATTGQIIFTLAQRKKPEMMQLITLAMVILFGGATLFFRNELFIKWKPTAVYWLMGLAFLLSEYIGEKNVVKRLLEKSLAMPDQAWTKLNRMWCGFFIFMGGLNLVVAHYFTTDVWVNFKLFGILGLTLVFVLAQGIMISKFIPEAKSSK